MTIYIQRQFTNGDADNDDDDDDNNNNSDNIDDDLQLLFPLIPLTERQTEGPTDTVTYRDAETHLLKVIELKQ